MRMHTALSTPTRQTTFDESTIPPRSCCGQSRGVGPIPHFQHTIANHALNRLPKVSAEESQQDSLVFHMTSVKYRYIIKHIPGFSQNWQLVLRETYTNRRQIELQIR